MTDVPVPRPSYEDGGHIPSSRGPHWLAQGGRVEKMLVGMRGARVMAGVPQAGSLPWSMMGVSRGPVLRATV